MGWVGNKIAVARKRVRLTPVGRVLGLARALGNAALL
jgi:hypothetical protein